MLARSRRQMPVPRRIGDRLLASLMLALMGLLAWVAASLGGLDVPTPEEVIAPLVLTRREVLASGVGPPAPHCRSGEEPQFAPALQALRQRLGPTMGEPLECEHRDVDSGDMHQRTTAGLAYFRRDTGLATFTDGWRHWAMGSSGAHYWEGEQAQPDS